MKKSHIAILSGVILKSRIKMLELFDQSLSVIILPQITVLKSKISYATITHTELTMLAQLPLMKPLWNKQICVKTKKCKLLTLTMGTIRHLCD